MYTPGLAGSFFNSSSILNFSFSSICYYTKISLFVQVTRCTCNIFILCVYYILYKGGLLCVELLVTQVIEKQMRF